MSPLRMMGIEPDSCIDIPLGHEWCGSGDDKELANGLLAFDCANCEAQFCITFSDGKWIASYQYTDRCFPEVTPQRFRKLRLLISKFPDMSGILKVPLLMIHRRAASTSL